MPIPELYGPHVLNDPPHYADHKAPIDSATFNINTQAGNDITVNIQLVDAGGDDMAAVSYVNAFVSDAASGIGIAATAPSGGAAAGTDGAVIAELVTSKMWTLQSEADGDIDLVITEAAADTWYLVVVLPNGRQVVSGAITFA